MHTPSQPTSDRVYGWTLISLALLTVAAMSQHPHPTRSGAQGFAQEFSEKATVNVVVHGSLIALSTLTVVVMVRFAERLGLRERLTTRAGLAAYIVGTLALCVAASINGLLLTRLAQRFVDAPADELAMLETLRILCKHGNFVADIVGIVSLCVAMCVWSVDVLTRGPRWLAAVGLVAGVTPLALLGTGCMPMTVAGMATFVVLHAVWCVAVGVALVRGLVGRA
ncbi:MAG TPA: hypothetical protein VK157_09525 [Phycisphaerales bacterium]|nr:hypothetical protein [Phycisphaerales bacterium]